MAKERIEEKLSLKETIEDINKTIGENTIINLRQKPHAVYDVIPTGSINFDTVVLGIGGFAKGRVYDIRGWEGCGKTTICGHLAANCQKQGGTVLYIDGEFSLDTEYFSRLGVDVDKLLICQPNNGNDGFEVALKLIGTGEIDLVIIDSDSSLLPKDVLENPVGTSNIGKKAKLNSDVYPKFKGLVNRTNTCMVVTSQYREKIGIMFGDPKTTQGGKALGFYADCIIELTKSLKKEGDEVVAHIVTMKTIKNKTYIPFKKATTDIVYGTGIDKIGELIELGKEYGVLRKHGGTITLLDENTKYTLEEFVTLLTDNEDFKYAIDKRIKAKINAE